MICNVIGYITFYQVLFQVTNVTDRLQKIRMGMIGGGQGAFIGEIHRMAARLDGQIELVAGAFSRNYENTLATGRALGIAEDRLYQSYELMMAREAELPPGERMDFVVIVTPNHLHVPAATAALKAGFHVLCDKPAGLGLSDVQTLARMIRETGLLYGLTHTYLGYPLVWQMMRMIEAGAIGAVRKVFVDYPQGWLSQAVETTGNQQAAWRTDPSQAGISGCMADIGTHAQCLAEFVTGQRITQISAELGHHMEGRRLDDDGTAIFKMCGGATGILIASQVLTGEDNNLSVRISGEQGSLEWHHSNPNCLIHKQQQRTEILRAGSDQPGLHEDALSRCRTPAGHPEGFIEAFANLYRDFAIAIRNKDTRSAPGVPGIQDGLGSMAFLEAMVASNASSDKWTNISLKTDTL